MLVFGDVKFFVDPQVNKVRRIESRQVKIGRIFLQVDIDPVEWDRFNGSLSRMAEVNNVRNDVIYEIVSTDGSPTFYIWFHYNFVAVGDKITIKF